MADWYPFKPQVRLRRWQGSPLGYCVYAGLWDWAFDNGGLPDSPRRVAAMLDLDEELIREVWPAFKADCVVIERGWLMPREIVDANSKVAATRQKRQDAGKAGGHASADARRKCDPGVNGQPADPARVDAIRQAAAALEQQISKNCSEPEGALATALEELFPAETAPHKFLDLGQFVLKVKACPADVRRWPDWFRSRYPTRAATIWTFKETLPAMVTEVKTLSTGARFIIATCFNVNSSRIDQLTQAQINLAITQGRILDDIVKLSTGDEWKAKGYYPNDFQQFFREKLNINSFPSPESVIKYWDDFKESLQ